jgi:hypothetical protein
MLGVNHMWLSYRLRSRSVSRTLVSISQVLGIDLMYIGGLFCKSRSGSGKQKVVFTGLRGNKTRYMHV